MSKDLLPVGPTAADAHVASPEQERAEAEFDRGERWPEFLEGLEEEVGVGIAESCPAESLGLIVRDWLLQMIDEGIMTPRMAIIWLRDHGCADLVRRAREAYVEEALER